MTPLLSLMLTSDAMVASYQCERVLTDGHFCRLQISLQSNKPIDLDQVDDETRKIMEDALERYFGEQEFTDAVTWFQAHWA